MFCPERSLRRQQEFREAMENEGPIQTVEYFSTRKFYAHGRFMSLISKGADRAVVILPEAFSACWKDIALKIGNFINYSPPRKSKAPHRMVDTNNSYAKVVENSKWQSYTFKVPESKSQLVSTTAIIKYDRRLLDVSQETLAKS